MPDILKFCEVVFLWLVQIRRWDCSLKSPGIKPTGGKSTSSYRKNSSSSCVTEIEAATPCLDRRPPPSSPTLSIISVFANNADDIDRVRDKVSSLPPELLPRSPVPEKSIPEFQEISHSSIRACGRFTPDPLPLVTRHFPMFGVDLRRVGGEACYDDECAPPPRPPKSPKFLSRALIDNVFTPRLANQPAVVRKTSLCAPVRTISGSAFSSASPEGALIAGFPGTDVL